MRRLLGTITLAAVAGAGPAIGPAVAVAATQPQTGPVQRFGARLVDVPASEANNPRGLRYIIDYLPTGTTIHRRILDPEPREADGSLHRLPGCRPYQR